MSTTVLPEVQGIAPVPRKPAAAGYAVRVSVVKLTNGSERAIQIKQRNFEDFPNALIVFQDAAKELGEE